MKNNNTQNSIIGKMKESIIARLETLGNQTADKDYASMVQVYYTHISNM